MALCLESVKNVSPFFLEIKIEELGMNRLISDENNSDLRLTVPSPNMRGLLYTFSLEKVLFIKSSDFV